MKTFASRNRNKNLSIVSAVFLGFLLTLGMQGCSDSKSPPPNFDAANGLFSGSGTVNTDVALDDVRGFVHDGRFIFFDQAEAVLYDGNFTSISDTAIQATVNVYEDGAKSTSSSVNVTGTLVSESSLILNFNGTGYAAGSLSLTFDTALYNRGATMARLAADSSARWIGDAHTPTTTVSGNVRILSDDDEADFTFSGDTGAPSQCQYNGVKSIPDANINIYLIDSMDVTQFVTSCDHLGTGYTGFFSVVDGDFEDDTVLFAVTNGTHSNFSIMTKPE